MRLADSVMLTAFVWTLSAVTACSDPTATPNDTSASDSQDTQQDATVTPDSVTPDSVTPEAVTPEAVDVSDTTPALNRVTILHTSDERGRLLPREVVNDDGALVVRGGAANVAGWWKEREGYSPATHIVLSSGNSWIGSPSSTWLRGESVVEVFGLMGFDAAAIGSRDFDFGRQTLLERIDEASYSFVSANMRVKATGELAPFVQATAIIRVGDVDVAIIGLMEVNSDANAADLADLDFADLGATIDREARLAREAGAEIVIALGSSTMGATGIALASLAEPIDLAFAARSGDAMIQDVGGVPLLVSGQYFDGYHAITLSHDPASGAVAVEKVEFVAVEYPATEANPVTPDAAVETAVAKWEAVAEVDLGEEIGYTATGLSRPSWPLANWVMDSWLAAFPSADIALQNSGGLQAAIAPGTVTAGDVVAVMPFENYILEVPMTGAQLRAAMVAMTASCGGVTPQCFVAVAGLTYEVTGRDLILTLAGGGPVVDDATYTVLLNNYLFVGGAGFPVDTGIVPKVTGQHMRDPVLAWTRALATSMSDPLEAHIDAVQRGL